MAVVIPIEKLVKGLVQVMDTKPIQVRLRDINTVFKDKVTGWTIIGSQIKELPIVSPGHPLSQQLFIAIRAGRFVRVINMKNKKRTGYEDLVNSIIKEYDNMGGLTGLDTDKNEIKGN